MRFFEKAIGRIRHLPFLEGADWLWDRLRPSYEALLRRTAGRAGLLRRINGTDQVRVSVAHRGCPDVYEPEVWPHVMAAVRPGDSVVDVGAYIGLYTVALANRAGPEGRVVAFEPNPSNFRSLLEHIHLNGLEGRVEVRFAAVGSETGEALIQTKGIESRLSDDPAGTVQVPLVRLDDDPSKSAVDVLKIDVEGYEERVLRGAEGLLGSRARRPRVIFIEVHPFAWSSVGTTSSTLLATLTRFGYSASALDGSPIVEITEYGEIVAVPIDGSSR